MADMKKPLDAFIEIMKKGKFETKGKKSTVREDYPAFYASMKTSRHPTYLTFYPEEEYVKKGARLYKLPGVDAGFAVDKDGDIISVHNNTDVRGLGVPMIQAAKARGGNHMDHFDNPKHNQVYGSQGFLPYSRWKFSDEYAPEGWNYETQGRPDLIMRGTPKFIEEFCGNPANAEACDYLDELPPELVKKIMRRRGSYGK